MQAQIAMVLLGIPAIYLIVKYDGWRESLGIVLGDLALPFIVFSALKGGQWGMLVLCAVFFVLTCPRLFNFVVGWFKSKFNKENKKS